MVLCENIYMNVDLINLWETQYLGDLDIGWEITLPRLYLTTHLSYPLSAWFLEQAHQGMGSLIVVSLI